MIHTRAQQSLSRCRQMVLQLQSQRQSLESKLLSRDPLVEGSLVIVRKVCGKAGCRCSKSKRLRHGPFLYLSLRRKGKTRTIHLPKQWEETVRKGVEEARRCRAIRREWRILASRLEKVWRAMERHRRHLPYEPKKKR